MSERKTAEELVTNYVDYILGKGFDPDEVLAALDAAKKKIKAIPYADPSK